ncbi:hypothetical protein ACWGNU_16235 [Paenibacillus lautus]
MTNPVTPNIGLNKIDRTSPSTTYFDLEKYIDQNADAVDQFAGESGEAIGALEKRLDTEEHREVVLQPGLQIVNAERSAPFKLSGIKGRTLVNLLGRDGKFETLQSPNGNGATLMLDKTNFTSGSSSVKVTSNGNYSNFASIGILISPLIDKTKYYLMALDVKNGDSEEGKLYLELQPNQASLEGNSITSTHKFETSFIRVSPNEMNGVTTMYLHGYLVGTIGKFAYFDSFRIYEISAAEYTALGSMTPEQVDATYPYVDSVRPVRNPYAIRYGENLLPPFYEWSNLSNVTINGPYTIRTVAPITGTVTIPVMPNTPYTLSGEITSTDISFRISYIERDSQGLNVGVAQYGLNVENPQKYVTFTTNEKTRYIHLYLNSGGGVDGVTAKFDNIMLNIGSTPHPFNTRENSMLALEVDLYADPVTGENADEVLDKDGQYFKIKKWSEIFKIGIDPLSVEDYALSTPSDGFPIGYKRIRVRGLIEKPVVLAPGSLVKYDGSIVPYGQRWSDAREQYVVSNNSGNYVLINAKNSDTGWGDNYTPTAEEIKAYFLGWKMFDVNDGNTWLTPYKRTDGLNKRWAKIYCGVGTNGSGPSFGTVAGSGIALVPTVINDMGYTPYQLVYQLATPTVEPIVSEGMLMFNEGDNQIEVGTGIVLRENAKFTSNGNGSYTYNSNVLGAEKARFIVKDFLELYENNKPIYEAVRTIRTISNGTTLDIPSEKFNPSSAYSTTYFMLDKSPIAPFTGSYAANEKSVLQELSDAVQQNATAVSVLMNKKTDRDTPGWITPTLINGWIPYADSTHYYGYTTAQYMKDSQGFVYLRGLIKKGSPSTIFYLPIGYRPKQSITFVTICYDGATEQVTRIRISSDGSVSYVVGPAVPAEASWLSLNLPPFTID